MLELAMLALLLTSTGVGSTNTVSSELMCLSKNIYHEARGENERGQIAVGFVTLERVLSKKFPNTICEVVYQKNAFSWTRHKNLTEKTNLLYGKCLESAIKSVGLKVLDLDTMKADHYHHKRVSPSWASRLTMVGTVGDHKFYRR